MTQNMFNQHAINCRALLIDKLVMNPWLLYVRITTIDIKSRDPHTSHDPFKMSASTGQWWLATTLRWAMSLYLKFR